MTFWNNLKIENKGFILVLCKLLYVFSPKLTVFASRLPWWLEVQQLPVPSSSSWINILLIHFIMLMFSNSVICLVCGSDGSAHVTGIARLCHAWLNWRLLLLYCQKGFRFRNVVCNSGWQLWQLMCKMASCVFTGFDVLHCAWHIIRSCHSWSVSSVKTDLHITEFWRC